MLLPRSTQLPCGVKDAKVNLLADSTRSSMGLWSYILRLTLLVKGKQKKSRAAPRETARVFHNRHQPVSRIDCCFSSLSIQGFDQGCNWPLVAGAGTPCTTSVPFPKELADGQEVPVVQVSRARRCQRSGTAEEGLGIRTDADFKRIAHLESGSRSTMPSGYR